MRRFRTLALMIALVAACQDADRSSDRPAHAGSPTPNGGGQGASEAVIPPRPRFETATATVGAYFVDVRVEPYETFVDIRPLIRAAPTWHWRPTSQTLSLRLNDDQAFADQIPALTEMLRLLVDRQRLDLAQTSLRWRLDPWQYPDYSARLARFAATDRRWAPALRASKGSGTQFYRYIIDTTRRRRLHRELDAIFLPFGRRPILSGAEKCMRSRPGSSDEVERWMDKQGIGSKVSLPVGCLMATFNLRAAARASEGAR